MDKEAFDRLLGWLDADRERAAERYEEIRRRLIKIFVNRGCTEAEDLADKTFDRVCTLLPRIAPDYSGDPALYCYGVARKIYQEYLEEIKKRNKMLSMPPPVALENVEPEFECLEICLAALLRGDRVLSNSEIVVRYYDYDKQAKIDNRKELAETLGITLGALRVLAHRIRQILEECVFRCLEEREAA